MAQPKGDDANTIQEGRLISDVDGRYTHVIIRMYGRPVHAMSNNLRRLFRAPPSLGTQINGGHSSKGRRTKLARATWKG